MLFLSKEGLGSHIYRLLQSLSQDKDSLSLYFEQQILTGESTLVKADLGRLLKSSDGFDFLKGGKYIQQKLKIIPIAWNKIWGEL